MSTIKGYGAGFGVECVNQSNVLGVTESVDATRVTAVTVVRNGTPWVPFFVPAIFVPSVVP